MLLLKILPFIIYLHYYFSKNIILFFRINKYDSMKGAYLGCNFSNSEIKSYLEKIKAPFESLNDSILFEKLSNLLEEGKVIGWFNGSMEFGPRALGNRSIIGDPRNKIMQSIMNLKIKFRESFRPFAPVVLENESSKWFDMDYKSPYMMFVANLKDNKKIIVNCKYIHRYF